MKKIVICIMLFASFSGFSQAISINTTTYTPTQLINNVLINSPCVSGTNVTARTGSNFGSTNGIGYFTNTNTLFPFTSGVVLTTGDVTKVPSPNDAILSDGSMAWLGDADLEASLLSQSGITMHSVNASVLEFDFTPKTANFDFSFLFASEEYGSSQCNFSDAFAFLLTDLTTGITTNIAVIPGTNIPVSVETIRNNLYNTQCASANPSYFGAFNVAGFGPAINFNGQTVEMTATAAVDITHQYHIKLVIADGGNNVSFDSAIFIEANSFNIGQNVLGPDYSTANGTAICPGAALPVLSAAGLDPATTYVWKQGNTVISSASGPTLDLNGALPSALVQGSNTFSVTYTEPGCVAITDSIIVEISRPLNVIATVPDIYTCDTGAPNYTFDLTKNTAIILSYNTATPGDDLPAGTSITYYASQPLADTGNTADQLPTSYTITAAQTGITIYARIRLAGSNCYTIRSFQLNIVPTPTVTSVPIAISLCARNNTETLPKAVFDFTAAIAAVLGTQDPTYNVITFHSTPAGATSTTNNTTNLLSVDGNNQTLSTTRDVYVRIQNISNPGCFATANFHITVKPLPLVDIFADVFVCTSYTLPVLVQTGSQYWTQPNATGTQYLAGDVITADATLYVYHITNGCSSEDSFNITIVDLPVISPNSDIFCTRYVLPSLPYGNYYTGTNGSGTLVPSGTIVDATTTLYVYFEDTTVTPMCRRELSFTITIIPFIPLPDYPDQFACTSYTLAADVNGGTYYAGPGKTGGIVSPGPITATTTIYVYKETNTTPLNCRDEESFTVYIGLSSITTPGNQPACPNYTLPDLPFGQYWSGQAGTGTQYHAGEVLSATTTLYFYVPGESCTDNLPFTITVTGIALPVFTDQEVCGVYFLPAVAHSGNYYTGQNGTGTLLAVNTPITSTQAIYFYDPGTAGTCAQQDSFLVKINPLAPLDRRADVVICNASYTLDDLTNGEYYAAPGGLSPTNPVLPPGTVISASQTLYLHAAPVAPIICADEFSIDITITNIQVTPIADIYECNSYILPAIAGVGDYYTLPGGPNITGGNTKMNAGDPITTTTTLYVYADDSGRTPCTSEDTFIVTILHTPVVAPITAVPVCDSYPLPAYNTFSTTPANAVNHYYTLAGGPGTAGNVEKFPGDFITESTTIYVYAEVGTLGTKICFDEQPLAITINHTPILEAVAAVTACDSYTLTALTTGNYYSDALHTLPITNLTLTATQTVYVHAETGTTPNCAADASFIVTINYSPVFTAAEVADVEACNSYTLPPLSIPSANYYTGPDGTGTLINAGEVYTSNQLIYAYAINAGCPTNEDINISVYKVDDFADLQACLTYSLPPLTTAGANYYTGPNGTGTLLNAGDPILNTQTIYIYGVAPYTTACSSQTDFVVQINIPPTANAVPDALTTVCDLDGVDDGITGFDLDSLTATILGSQDPAIYQVAYYRSVADYVSGTAIVTDGGAGTDTEDANLFATVYNIVTPDCSSNPLVPITIYVIPLPQPGPLTGTICTSSVTGAISPAIIDSMYSSSLYTFSWTDSTGAVVSTAAVFQTAIPGAYSLAITAIGTLTACESGPIPVTVIESFQPDEDLVSFTSSGWFTDRQTLVVNYAGDATNLVYSLDGQTPQASNTFTNVSSGMHEVTLIDSKGCGSLPLPVPVKLINSPKAFTPNGDGFNDTWQITGLEDQTGSRLFIFDRYGKLLKQLFVNGPGWDGTYNGQQLPSTDYWFTLTYIENGVPKEYKSHFSLIR